MKLTHDFTECETFAKAMELVEGARVLREVKEVGLRRMFIVVYSNGVSIGFESMPNEQPTIWARHANPGGAENV